MFTFDMILGLHLNCFDVIKRESGAKPELFPQL